jgi:hypothetical protein
MSEYLPFWPKAGIGALIGGASSVSIFSRSLPTTGFTEVVIQMELDATFGSHANTKIDVVPQVSNDGINWKDLTSATLQIVSTATFPAQDTEKFTEIAAFMRMKITISNGEADGLSHWIVATLAVMGAGRS